MDPLSLMVLAYILMRDEHACPPARPVVPARRVAPPPPPPVLPPLQQIAAHVHTCALCRHLDRSLQQRRKRPAPRLAPRVARLPVPAWPVASPPGGA